MPTKVMRLGSASPSIVHRESPAKPEGLEGEPVVSRSNTGHALRLGTASPSIVHRESPAKPEGLEGEPVVSRMNDWHMLQLADVSPSMSPLQNLYLTLPGPHIVVLHKARSYWV
jgi:hypothetical protein